MVSVYHTPGLRRKPIHHLFRERKTSQGIKGRLTTCAGCYQVYNNSHRFTGQAYGGNNYHCSLEATTTTAPLNPYQLDALDPCPNVVDEAPPCQTPLSASADKLVARAGMLTWPVGVAAECDLGMLFGQCPSNKESSAGMCHLRALRQPES
eukprot:2474698-Rhodomonas_salina.1